MSDKELLITVDDLPLNFTVKYLGNHPAKGIWGIKYTRKPVDILVNKAKNLPECAILPLVEINISKNGFSFTEIKNKKLQGETHQFSVDKISYGVQDLVYTRVFSMIIVVDDTLKSVNPFLCHSFVCDSKDQARKITYALAAAFQDYGKKVKEEEQVSGKPIGKLKIDLRTPEELAQNYDAETDV